MFDLSMVQTALQKSGFDGWLLYDFRGSNVPARRVLDLPAKTGSRRFFYFVPAHGKPHKLVHAIEDSALDHLPGNRTIYLRWEELEAGVENLLKGSRRVAMEYSPRNGNPYVSRVDAGTLELVRSFDVEVGSSGDLVQLFEAVWSDERWKMHRAAEEVTTSAFDVAWGCIADAVQLRGGIEERDVQAAILQHFDSHGLTTYSPPIVARGSHSGLPHYETGEGKDTLIREGDLVLVDLWAKLDRPGAVYSDLTRTAYVGTTVPENYRRVFDVVAAGRDAGVECVRRAFAENRPLQGHEVDEAVRSVIEKAGYGSAFRHRTGHNIGQEVHGNGANMDSLETFEERRVLPRTCFSIEPGIYLPEFGIRSEINVFVDKAGTVHVTGGPVQTEIVPLFAPLDKP